MRAAVTGATIVRIRCSAVCDDPDCEAVREELATLVNDAHGWLFYTLADPDDDGPSSRLLPVSQVLGVQFFGPLKIEMDGSEGEVFARHIGQAIETGQAEPLAIVSEPELEPVP